MINKPYRSAMAHSMPGWEWVTNRTFALPATTNYRTVLVISGIYMLICPSTTSVISSTSSSFWKWYANSAAGSCFLMIKSTSICSKWGSWRKDTQRGRHCSKRCPSRSWKIDLAPIVGILIQSSRKCPKLPPKYKSEAQSCNFQLIQQEPNIWWKSEKIPCFSSR